MALPSAAGAKKKNATTLLILAVVYAGMIPGGVPFLQLHRTRVPVTLATLAISWLYLGYRIL